MKCQMAMPIMTQASSAISAASRACGCAACAPCCGACGVVLHVQRRTGRRRRRVGLGLGRRRLGLLHRGRAPAAGRRAGRGPSRRTPRARRPRSGSSGAVRRAARAARRRRARRRRRAAAAGRVRRDDAAVLGARSSARRRRYTGSRSFQCVSTWEAMKTDEYVPEIVPTSSANAKSCSVSPPKSSSDEHRQRRGERRRQRADDDLGHRAVDDLRERRARHARHVLPDAVEHDDRVVEREAQDGQQRRDRRRRHLPAGEGVDARGDQQVVRQRDEHRHRVLPLEPQREVDADHDQRRDDRDDRAACATVSPNVGPIDCVLGSPRDAELVVERVGRRCVHLRRAAAARSRSGRRSSPSSGSSTRWISASAWPCCREHVADLVLVGRAARARRGSACPTRSRCRSSRPLPPIASAQIEQDHAGHREEPLRRADEVEPDRLALLARAERGRARDAACERPERAEDRLREQDRGEQRDDRADAEREREALDARGREHEQDERDHDRHDVRVDDRRRGPSCSPRRCPPSPICRRGSPP